MRDEKFLKILDGVILAAFYILAAGITFSNALTEIAVAIIIGLWIVKKIMTKDCGIPGGALTYILMAFILWNALSFFNSGYMDESTRGLLKVVKYAFLFMVTIDHFNSRKGIKRFLLYSLSVAFFISLNGIYQYISGTDLIRSRVIDILDHLYRVSSSFVHPNDFGAYLVVMLTILLSLFFSSTRKFKERILTLLATLLFMWAVFATKSRGAWIGLVIALIALFSIKSRKMLVVILLLLLASPLIMPKAVRERFADIAQIKVSGSAWERTRLWQGAIDMVKAHPLLGHGVNTYSKNFPAYKPSDYPDSIYPHNSFLQMAAETGIIGAGLFIIFLFSLIINVAGGIGKPVKGVYRDLYLGLLAGITGFLCHCFVDTHLYSTTLACFLFMYLGIAVAFKKAVYEECE
jgi:putative inorganic carbon (hco3(-)) transporter